MERIKKTHSDHFQDFLTGAFTFVGIMMALPSHHEEAYQPPQTHVLLERHRINPAGDGCKKAEKAIGLAEDFRSNSKTVIKGEDYKGEISVRGFGPVDISNMWNDPPGRNGKNDTYYIHYKGYFDAMLQTLPARMTSGVDPNIYRDKVTLVIREGTKSDLDTLVFFSGHEGLSYCLLKGMPAESKSLPLEKNPQKFASSAPVLALDRG